MEKRPRTIIIDIDGTILYHYGNLILQQNKKPKLLKGVIEKFAEWEGKGYRILLLTGRKESMRKKTIEQLETFGIYYDELIMGCGGGIRVLINDLKPNSEEPTAIAINIKRNKGLNGIE